MPFNILLLPLLGGFIFVRFWNRTKYPAIRADKERILLLASTAGLIALAWAFAIRSLLGALFPCSLFPQLPCFPKVWYAVIPFPYSAVSVLAFLLGALLWIPLNKGVVTWAKEVFTLPFWFSIGVFFQRMYNQGWQDAEEVDRVINEDGDPMDMLLRLAEKQYKTISATLKSGKVYIGFVSSTNPPSSATRSVGIVPTKSGYRDPKTKKVTYETYYSDALSRLDQDIEDLISDWRTARRVGKALKRKRKNLEKLRATEVEPSEGADRPAVDAVGLEADIENLKQQIHQIGGWRTEIRREVDNLVTVINDFRLVFPIEEISSLSIYREEINIEYFSPPSPAVPSSQSIDSSNLTAPSPES